MKPITLISLFCTAYLLASAASAQQAPVEPPPSQGPERRLPPSAVDMLLRTLQLTDAQKTQLQPYLDAAQPQLTAIREQAREAEATVITQLSSQIRPLLTSDQQTRLDALQVLRTTAPAQTQR